MAGKGVTELLAALGALGPYEFTATTVAVKETAVRPVTVIGEDAPDAVNNNTIRSSFGEFIYE